VNINQAFPSNFLKAADLAGKKVTLRVDSVVMEDIGDGEKPVMHFMGKDKGLVLNKTNAGTISSAYGPDTDNWYGKEVKLYPTKVSYQGQMVDAIRVEIPVPEAVEGEDPPF